jgi:hypothetical protein
MRGAAGIGLGTTTTPLQKNNKRRREQRPEHHDQVPFESNALAGNNWAKAHIHKSWARFLLNPLVV